MTPSTQHIGFIGLGIMGSRMAQHLLSAGYHVTITNRTRSKAVDLITHGAVWADSPADVAREADILITMLAHPEAVESMALGEDGFLDALPAGALWVDCSTVNPAFARRMAQQAEAHNIRFMDAPVAGSKNQAQDAQLMFFVGGASEDVEIMRPLFDAMGQRVNHIGGHGMGNALKLVVNHLLATSMIAFAEGMVLGESLGIDRDQLLTMLVGSAVVPPYMAGKRDKIANDDYTVEFPLRWMQKDMQMVAETAFTTQTAMPVANATKEAFQLAIRQGLGDEDFSAIYAFLKGNAS